MKPAKPPVGCGRPDCLTLPRCPDCGGEQGRHRWGIRIYGGPADGVDLMLQASPVLLRITCRGPGSGGKMIWDALDQMTDMPEPGEDLFLYVLQEPPTAMFVRAARGQSGRFVDAAYRTWSDVMGIPQPPEETMRDPAEWERWRQLVRPHVLLQLPSDLQARIIAADRRRAAGGR